MRLRAFLGFLFAILPLSVSAAIHHGRDGPNLWISSDQLRISINQETGRYDCDWISKSMLRNVTCSAHLSDGTEVDAASYPLHQCGDNDIRPLIDPLGMGIEVIIHHRKSGLPELRQRIDVYEGTSFFVTSVELVSQLAVATNHIEVVATDSGMQLPVDRKPRLLFVPFDNDSWVRFNNSRDPAKDPDSYEVSAIYDNISRRGLVFGSISHDLWKTGIQERNVSAGGVGHLTVYAGASGSLSRDSLPHGMISGTVISSPRIFVGSFSDWRVGMEGFAQANAQLNPPLKWEGGAIFGWNSWAAYGGKIDFEKYVAASDFVAKKLQPGGFACGSTVFINWDAGFSKCTEQQLSEAARHVHANGQKAGIYFTPFAAWHVNPEREVEGTHGQYHYKDILARDSSGRLLPELDNGQPLDPTHPGTLRRIDWQLARFVDWGYDLVKLDFLNFGALESAHFNPAITTGIAAYNLGMGRIVADLDVKKVGRPFFISLSIAPIFPGGYGHARRISCDAFGTLHDSEYMLNSVSYGWWMNSSLYILIDPDHTVLTNLKNPTTFEEARTRVNASLVAGGMLIDSDDLTDPAAQTRAMLLLTNPRINALARSGRAFHPVEGNSGDRAAACFVRTEPDGSCYLALFNFDSEKSATRTISLTRLGLSGELKYRAMDLWDGKESPMEQAAEIPLGPGQSRLLHLTSP